MVSIPEYFQAKIVLFIITNISTVITFGCITSCFTLILKKKISFGAFLLGNICMALIFHVPQFVVNYFFYPKLYDVITDNIMIFPLPIGIFIYYFIFRDIFKVSKFKTLISLEWVMTSQLIVMLLFKIFTNIWAVSLVSFDTNESVFPVDLMATVCTMLSLVIFYLIFKSITQKYEFSLAIPSSFPVENTFTSLFKSFILLCSNYCIIVIVGILLMSQRRVEITIGHVVIYALLLAILAYRMVDSIRSLKMHVLECQAKTTESYINSLLRESIEFRSIKHDFNNILQVYGGYISAENIEGLRKFHDSLVKEVTDIGKNLDLIEALRSRIAVYTVFDVKYQYAKENGIFLEIENAHYIKDVKMDDLDLCRILGNLLDNAIEAAVLSDEKKICLRCEKNLSNIIITISNSTGSDIDIRKIFEHKYTTKKGHNGHGLTSVSNIVKDYCEYNMDVFYKNYEFTVTLTLGLL